MFERTGRSVELTQFGIELLDHVRAMARGADMVSLSALGQSQSIEGQVRITASELTSALVLPPIIREIAQQAPSLEIDVVSNNSMRDFAVSTHSCCATKQSDCFDIVTFCLVTMVVCQEVFASMPRRQSAD